MKNTCIDYLINLFEEALEQLYKLREAAREYGIPSFSLLPEKTALELTTAHRTLEELWNNNLFQKEYGKILHRNRTRRWRARKKQEQETATACDGSVTPGDEPVTACDAPVTIGGENTLFDDDFAKKEKETEKRKNQRKEINKNKKIFKTNIADAMPNSARAHTREEEADAEKGNCLPFQPPEKKPQALIPTDHLPEVYRNVVSAWNQLPLSKKLSGLYPSLVKRLNYLLENYGEEQIHNAIASIADSPFLLGKSKNNRGWVVSINWFMEPDHLEKILSGEYHDEKRNSKHCLFQPGDELQPWGDGFYGSVVY